MSMPPSVWGEGDERSEKRVAGIKGIYYTNTALV